MFSSLGGKKKKKKDDLGDHGGLIDLGAVDPAVDTVLLLETAQVNVAARQQPAGRKVAEHIQPVAAAAAWLQLPVHHLPKYGQENLNTFCVNVETRAFILYAKQDQGKTL